MAENQKPRISMNSIELKVQEEDNFCLCSVLQTILKRKNIEISQREIANNLTPSDNGFFADDLQIKNFMRINGFNYQFYGYNQTPFNEPDMLLLEMNENDGLLGINNHIYLLENFKYPKIEMIDPKNGELIQTDIYQTIRKMESDGGFYGLIKYIH